MMASAQSPDGWTSLPGRRGSDSWRAVAAIALTLALAGILSGCVATGGQTASPEGSVVGIHSAGDRIVIDPPSVPAGTVHLESSTPGVVLISASSGGDQSAMEPLDDEALARLERGDFKDTLTQGTEGAFGGPQFTVELPVGLYAFAIMPMEYQQDVAPIAISVLTVEAPPLPSTEPDETTTRDWTSLPSWVATASSD